MGIMLGPIFMVVIHTLEIAIYVLKPANGGLFYTPLQLQLLKLCIEFKAQQHNQNTSIKHFVA